MTGSGIHLQKRLSRAGRTTLIGLVAAAMSWVVLFGTLQAALTIPSEERLSPLARAGALDYSLRPGGVFESLRASFIAKILGLEPPTARIASGSSPDDSILAASFAPTPIAPIPGRLPRTIVEHPFDNDDFEDAYPVPTIPFTGKTDTRAADREDGEPDACEPAGGTVWYRYRPTRNLGLLANSFGSDHAIALGVFRGQDLNSLTLVGCALHAAGNAHVTFPAKKDRSYFFQVAAPVSGGKLVFSLDPLGTTRMVSVARNGKEGGDRGSAYAAVSADGRYVSFHSNSRNLVRREEKKTCFWRDTQTQDCPDVYVRDLSTGRTELVSKNSRGVSSNGVSEGSAISGDGRYVVFRSTGDNLVPHDDNDTSDIFVHDRHTHKTERVSVSSEGKEGTTAWAGNRTCKDDMPPQPTPEWEASFREFCKNTPEDFFRPGLGISSDGRYVVFASSLHGLVEPEPPHCTDFTSQDYFVGLNHGPRVPLSFDIGPWSCRQVYVHDRKKNETRLVSVSSDGRAVEGDSAGPFISRNGRWVAFSSSADKLVARDDNGYRDVFLHDLRTGATELVSVSTWGQQGDAQSGGTNQRGHNTVSDNGRWIAFISHASNLTEDDGNPVEDIFLRDRRSGQTVLVSAASESAAQQTDHLARASHASISTNGRYIGFTAGTGLLSQEPNELFVYDRVTRTITKISVPTSGEDGECGSLGSAEPEISADGHFVVFESDCTNLDNRYRDDGGNIDVFIHALGWAR